MQVLTQQVDVLMGELESTVIQNFGKILNVPYNNDEYDEARTKHAIEACVNKGHLSVLEHASATLICTTNIGTYKDFTRHRHCAFTIESTSFSKYKDLTVIAAQDMQSLSLSDKLLYDKFYDLADNTYSAILKQFGPKIARDVLPQATAAKMVMTTNFREWRWIIALRGDPNDNPLTNELRDKMWTALNWHYPFFFPLPPSENEGQGPMTIKDAWGKRNIAQLRTNRG